MICPKIDHHFLQLPLAVGRAQNAGHLKLAGDELRRTQIVLFEVSVNGAAILGIGFIGFASLPFAFGFGALLGGPCISPDIASPVFAHRFRLI